MTRFPAAAAAILILLQVYLVLQVEQVLQVNSLVKLQVRFSWYTFRFNKSEQVK
jgi:hypothetical protein